MLSQIAILPTPSWIRAAKLRKYGLPIREVLTNSVYYPACGLDGDPIQYLGGNFHSFIYVDYGLSREQVIGELPRFRGYELAACRDVARHEFTFKGWTPTPPLPEDGDPHDFFDIRKPPFAVWSIHQRRQCYAPHHGPERFSLLYIGGEGVEIFQSLYYATQTTPTVVAVIQPGHSFGLNWTNFEKEDGYFGRSVLANPFGKPGYLLYGGKFDEEFYSRPCWRSFSQPVATLHSRLRLWRCESGHCTTQASE